MHIPYYAIPTLRHEWDDYMATPRICVKEITHKLIQCVPLITALLTIGTFFSLFNELEARYIPYQEIKTTSTTSRPDDIKIVPIAKAVWMYQKKARSFCGLSNPWCMKGHSL